MNESRVFYECRKAILQPRTCGGAEAGPLLRSYRRSRVATKQSLKQMPKCNFACLRRAGGGLLGDRTKVENSVRIPSAESLDHQWDKRNSIDLARTRVFVEFEGLHGSKSGTGSFVGTWKGCLTERRCDCHIKQGLSSFPVLEEDVARARLGVENDSGFFDG